MGFAQENPYQAFGSTGVPAAFAEESARVAFIRRTYLHVLGAMLGFVGIEAAVFGTMSEQSLHQMVGSMVTGYNWLIVLGAFMFVSWIAERWASSDASQGVQYLGLTLYVLAEAVIFVPLLYVAQYRLHDPNLIPAAGVITLVIFFGITAVVFLTKADYSGIGKYLWFAGIAALGLIVCSIFFGLSLGVWFSLAMVVLASGYILYYTSNILHHYRTDQHVAAALALFAAVALLFWYVLRIVMALSNRD